MRQRVAVQDIPHRAGQPWSQGEDKQLWTERDQGLSVPEIARAHQRTLVGIEARIDYLKDKPRPE